MYLLLIIEFHSQLKKWGVDPNCKHFIVLLTLHFTRTSDYLKNKVVLEDLQCNQASVSCHCPDSKPSKIILFKAIIKATLLSRFQKKAGHFCCCCFCCLFGFFYLYTSFDVLNSKI